MEKSWNLRQNLSKPGKIREFYYPKRKTLISCSNTEKMFGYGVFLVYVCDCGTLNSQKGVAPLASRAVSPFTP